MTISDDNLISVISAVLSIGVTYGITKAKLIALESRVGEVSGSKDQNKEDLIKIKEELSQKIYDTRDTFVTYKHFEEVISSIRDDQSEIKREQHEIKNDIKSLLSMVSNLSLGSKRPRN